MYNLLKFEIYKLKHNKAFKISLIITLFLIINSIYLFFYDKSTVKIINNSLNGKDFGFLVNIFQDRKYPKAIEFFYSSFGFCPIISILVMFLVGRLVIDEYSNGTMKNIVMYGHNRIKIYISKLIIVFLCSFILICLLLFGTAIIGNIITRSKSLSFSVFAQMIRFTILTAIIFASITSIYVCLAILVRNKSILLSSCILAMILISSYLPNLNNFTNFIKFSPTFMLIKIGTLKSNVPSIIPNCIILIIISTLIGAFTFKKLDLK